MADRPTRCPFCSNTDLAPAGKVNWSCVGSLGCGATWDPRVVVAPPPRPARPEEEERERPRKPVAIRAKRRALRRGPGIRLFPAA